MAMVPEQSIELLAVRTYVSSIVSKALAASTVEASACNHYANADVTVPPLDLFGDVTIMGKVESFLSAPQHSDVVDTSSGSASRRSSSSSSSGSFAMEQPVLEDFGGDGYGDDSDLDSDDLIVFEDSSFNIEGADEVALDAVLEDMVVNTQQELPMAPLRVRVQQSLAGGMKTGMAYIEELTENIDDAAEKTLIKFEDLVVDKATIIDSVAGKYVQQFDGLVNAKTAFVIDKYSVACKTLDSTAAKYKPQATQYKQRFEDCVSDGAERLASMGAGGQAMVDRAKAGGQALSSAASALRSSPSVQKGLQAAREHPANVAGGCRVVLQLAKEHPRNVAKGAQVVLQEVKRPCKFVRESPQVRGLCAARDKMQAAALSAKTSFARYSSASARRQGGA